MGQEFLFRGRLFGERAIVAYFVALKLILCLFPFEYGFFRDELYNIALSDNLDFGYVDVPPIVPLLLAGVRYLLGTSFLSLHLLPAICGALVVWIVSLMVKRMGGGFNALLLALACVTVAPVYICWESMYTYDAFDKLCWAVMLYMMVSLLKTEDKRYWVFFGIVAGLGLMTKMTALFLGFSIFLALPMTKERRYLLSWQFWGAGAIAFLIFSPYLLWQMKEGLPALEYYKAYVSGKTWPVTPVEFIKNQAVMMNPFAFPVWLLGLYGFVFNKKEKEFRVLGYAYLVILVLCMCLRAKFYLPAPFYTVLLAGGAVAIEQSAKRRSSQGWPTTATVLILMLGLAAVPLVRPVLPVEVFKTCYGRSAYMGIRGERHKLGRLRPHFADRFGWEEMAQNVADVYHRLSEEERSKACVLTQNYGEAGAIWLFGGQHNLPKPISGHLQYYLWGHRGHSGEVAISIGIDLQKLKDHWHTVEKRGEHACSNALRYERYLDIYVCREPKKPLKEMWPSFKHMD